MTHATHVVPVGGSARPPPGARTGPATCRHSLDLETLDGRCRVDSTASALARGRHLPTSYQSVRQAVRYLHISELCAGWSDEGCGRRDGGGGGGGGDDSPPCNGSHVGALDVDSDEDEDEDDDRAGDDANVMHRLSRRLASTGRVDTITSEFSSDGSSFSSCSAMQSRDPVPHHRRRRPSPPPPPPGHARRPLPQIPQTRPDSESSSSVSPSTLSVSSDPACYLYDKYMYDDSETLTTSFESADPLGIIVERDQVLTKTNIIDQGGTKTDAIDQGGTKTNAIGQVGTGNLINDQTAIELWSLQSIWSWLVSTFTLLTAISRDDIIEKLTKIVEHLLHCDDSDTARDLASDLFSSLVSAKVLLQVDDVGTACTGVIEVVSKYHISPICSNGILTKYTAGGCYSYACHSKSLRVGEKCYSYSCLFEDVKRSGRAERIIGESDWTRFWKLPVRSLRRHSHMQIRFQNIVHEFICKDEEFIVDLLTLRNIFLSPIISAISNGRFTLIGSRGPNFKEVEQKLIIPIERVHSHLLKLLKSRQKLSGPFVNGVAKIFAEWCSISKVRGIYVVFASCLPYMEDSIRYARIHDPEFRSWEQSVALDNRTRKLDVLSFLQSPTRRLQRYSVHFKEMSKCLLSDPPELEYLSIAIKAVSDTLNECNDKLGESVRAVELYNLESQLTAKNGSAIQLDLSKPGRRVIYRGDLLRRSDRQLEWIIVHVILLDSYLVMAKRKSGKDSRYYVSKKPIPLDLLDLEEVRGDPILRSSTRFLGTLSAGWSRKTISESPVSNTPFSSDSEVAKDRLLFPFCISYLSAQNGGNFTLYADSASMRRAWIDKIILIKSEKAKQQALYEPFILKYLSTAKISKHELVETTTHPPLIPGSSLHRIIEGGILTLRDNSTPGNETVICAKKYVWQSDESTVSMIAVGTEDGVWTTELVSDKASAPTYEWSKVLSLPKVTSIKLIEKFSLCILISDKTVYAYPLDYILPIKYKETGFHKAQRPQKLCSHVNYFEIGDLKGRTLIFCYRREITGSSALIALEPVIMKRSLANAASCPVDRQMTHSFREYEQLQPSLDWHSMICFRNALVLNTSKGFQAMSWDMRDYLKPLPDPASPLLQIMMRRLEGMKPINIYRLPSSELLLCYNECALFTDKFGKVSRSDIIDWHGRPHSTAFIGRYVVGINTNFLEVWETDGQYGLVQLITAKNIRLIGRTESSIILALNHPQKPCRNLITELFFCGYNNFCNDLNYVVPP